MNWVHVVIVLAALVGILGKEIDDINDISISPPPPINLDSNLRKALLRALTELENEDKSEDGDNSKTVYFSTTSRIDSDSDKIVEKASASAVTIFANSEVRTSSEDEVDETTTTKVEDETEKPIVIIQKSNGIQQTPITSNNLQDSNNEEQFIASASSSFTEDQTFNKEGHQTRSVSTPINFNSVSINDKSITSGVKSVSITPKTETTSPFPTTTTEESEAKVKPEDVQFFSAPLVAAFTVHQDERGLPEKVEPIYKSIGTTVNQGQQQEQQLPQQQSRTKQTDFSPQNGFTRQPIDFTRNSFNIQSSQQTDFNDFNRQEEYRKQLAFRQKQSALEEQIYKLEQQQKTQQDYLLRQQQVFQNQFDSQRALNEKVRLSQNDAPFMPIANPVPNFVQFNKGNQLSNNQLSNNQLSSNQLNANQLSNNQLNNNQFNINQLSNNQLNGNQLSNNQLNGNQFNQNQFNSQFNVPNTAQNNFNKNQNSANPFNNINSNFNRNQFKGTVVSFQPSLSLTPEEVSANILPLNAQILPVRNAVDFRQVPVPQSSNNFQQFNSLTPPVHNNNNNFGGFQTFPNNFVQSLPNVRQSNRVFRQEPETGNFGINNFNVNRNNVNQFQTQLLPQQQQQQQQNRFFRSNAESFQNTNQNFHQPQKVNQHLNNLLFQSGIRNVRQNDDLSIVSKILSYNVGRDNLFVGSRVNEQRLPNH